MAQLRVPPPTPTSLNEVWTMDYIHDQLADGRKIRALTLVDKLSRESLAIRVHYGLRAPQVIAVFVEQKATRGLPSIICVDNGSEFTSKALNQWAYINQVRIHFIRPGKPTENGHIEAFNGRFRDECLNSNVFLNLAHAQEELRNGELATTNFDRTLRLGTYAKRVCAKKGAENCRLITRHFLDSDWIS